MFCVPVKTLLAGAVFIWLTEEDQAFAGNAVDHRGIGFRLFELEGAGMGPAGEGGGHELAIAVQGKAEEIDSED